VGVFSWIASLFTLKADKFHPVLGLVIMVVALVPLLVLKAAGHEELWLSFTFGLLVTGISDIVVKDPYAIRVRWSVAIVLVGALLTALGYLLGGANWFLVALLVFVSTLLSYLVTVYGRRGTVAGVLLNVWFLIALSTTFALNKSPAQAWPLVGPQVLAWVAGGALWLVVAWVLWLVRRARQPTAATPLQETGAAQLSRPLVVFAALAALAVGWGTGVAWGFNLPNALWLPVATVVALRPSMQASAYVAGQRVAGALLGAILSGILLTTVHDRTVLAIFIALVVALGVALHEVNYALYCTCIATAVLIGLGLSHPGSLADNWERVAWTLAGIGNALLVGLVIDLARSRAAPRAATAE
jgi:hypothetical protein